MNLDLQDVSTPIKLNSYQLTNLARLVWIAHTATEDENSLAEEDRELPYFDEEDDSDQQKPDDSNIKLSPLIQNFLDNL